MIMVTPTRAYGAFATAVVALGLLVLSLPEQAQQYAVPVLTFGALTAATCAHVGHALLVRHRAARDRDRTDGPPASWREWWDRLE